MVDGREVFSLLSFQIYSYMYFNSSATKDFVQRACNCEGSLIYPAPGQW